MSAFSKIIAIFLLLSIFLSTNHRLLARADFNPEKSQASSPIHVDDFVIIQTLNAVLLNPVVPTGKEQLVLGCLYATQKRQFSFEITEEKVSSRSSFGVSHFILLTRLPGEAVYFLLKILI